MDKLIIRKATILDAKDILDINIESWKKTYNNIFPKEYLDNLDNNYDVSLNKIKNRIQQGKSLVAQLNGQVVGFCNYGVSKKEQFATYGEIYSLYVRNTYVKKGIGTKLFDAAVNELRKEYNKIIVCCLKENSSNQFYVKMNCEKIGECDFLLNGIAYKENIYKI